ncbi:MAG: hypothetical protein ACRDJV_02565 [Actinomycetota bacterium]
MIRALAHFPVLYIALLFTLTGCSSEPASDRGSKVTVLPRATTGPYVSVAVDNHFHDIHPEDDIEIAADRPFVVKNQGNNLHNVSIVGTDVRKDIRPGKVLRTPPLGEFLETGETYDVICRFHDSQGMTGQFTVVE